VGIYFALRRRSMTAAWGDLRYGALMAMVRATLLQVRQLPVAPRNWRPHILLFAGDPEKRIELVRFAAWLNQDRGILTVVNLIVGDLEQLQIDVPTLTSEMDEQLADEGLTAFAEVDVVTRFESGVIAVAQANGIAGIASNTLMLGWSDKEERLVSLLRVMRRASLIGKSTIICRTVPRQWGARHRSIDVWWGGLENNGDLLLLLAHLLSLNSDWRGVQIRINSIASSEMMQNTTRTKLNEMLDEIRIPARVEVTLKPTDLKIHEIIQEQSRNADIVFLGLHVPEPGEEHEYAARLSQLVGDLPTVILVRNAGSFAGKLL